MTDVDKMLEERGKRYGQYTGQSRISQGLKDVMRAEDWAKLSTDQKESLEMIANKIGRILNGDHNFKDSWDDIAGYAKLVADRLSSE